MFVRGLVTAFGARGVAMLLLAVGAMAAPIPWSPFAPAPARAASAPPAPIRLALIEGLSGPFANAGEAVHRNLAWAVERINARGGVRMPGGARPLELVRLDSKGNTEEALLRLRSATDQGIAFVAQGNSSAVASALVEAIERHNGREPDRRVLFLNYSAVEPVLTNEKCSYWHFRFDAHADMRLDALTDVMEEARDIEKVYLIGQDYSFGQHVVRKGREMIAAKRPDIAIVGEELHPMGRVRDFLPYATKIGASGAQAVLTGNWGNDLTLLVRAVRDLGLPIRFYTFYGNALGVPGTLGEAGVGAVLSVAEWHPNVGGEASDTFYAAFRTRYPAAADDYVHARMQAMVEMLAAAIERAGATDAAAVAQSLEGMQLRDTRHRGGILEGVLDGVMRAEDHQFQQPLVVSVMERAGTPDVRHDVEGSGYGFRTLRRFEPAEVAMPHRCRMARPEVSVR
jgi:branched-chain amino acid transport system substrate-binding protein